MSRMALRACVLLVAGGFLFAWVPDVDLGDGWLGGRAVSAPEARPHAASGRRDRLPRPGDRQHPRPEHRHHRLPCRGARARGLLLVATFHDLLPRVQQDVEFDLRTSQGRDLNVGVSAHAGR